MPEPKNLIEAECASCGTSQKLSSAAYERLRALHPDKPVICASCAVDRTGAFALERNDRAMKAQTSSRRRATRAKAIADTRQSLMPRNARPDADERQWLPPSTPKNAELTMLDLFCGPGGFSTGFEWAGFRSLLGVDIHEPSLTTFAAMHPAARTILGDVRELTGEAVSQLAQGRPDVITAGIPCEGFSRANRNRNDFIDARNFLFLEFLRLAEELSPRAVVVENVQALTSHSDGFFKREIVGGIESLGYYCYTQVLNASDYGVPQRRRRVIFVGLPPESDWAWPRPSHGPSGDFPARTVLDAISDLPDIGPSEIAEKYDAPPKNSYQGFARGDQRLLLNHLAPKHPPETIARIAATPPGEPMYPRFKQRIRLHPDLPSPTVVSGGIRPQFAHGHPWQPRGLTIRERARLQSFPDWYFFEGGVVQGRVQTGDAVPPLMAWRLAEQIRDALRGELRPERGLAPDRAGAQTALAI